jgi:hypothetical protein
VGRLAAGGTADRWLPRHGYRARFAHLQIGVTPAAWVSLAGAPALRAQRELLLMSRTPLGFGEPAYDGGLPILAAEAVS